MSSDDISHDGLSHDGLVAPPGANLPALRGHNAALVLGLLRAAGGQGSVGGSSPHTPG